MTFGTIYASIYDVLYQDKNYTEESRFALEQVRRPPAVREILDLGCGTGLHAVHLAQAGIFVTGVDRSAEMIAVAKKRKGLLPQDVGNHIDFRIGDIRTINCCHRYDAVISLFHVISYLVEDNDLLAAFQTARRHLNAGGRFLFDFWYGPAVLRNPPQPRIKSINVGSTAIKRQAYPTWDRERNVVCVNYDIEIMNTSSRKVSRESERHVVRYFFLEEIKRRLVESGFKPIRYAEWITGNQPCDETFSVYALAEAI